MRAVVVGLVTWALAAWAGFPGQTVAERRAPDEAFAVRLEQKVLANGLVVLLSPDATANDVVVDLTFGCGARRQPPALAGLAHLAEHALSTGTGAADVRALLERRGATSFNGATTIDHLSYVVAVPPEELPLALWANAERLGTLPGLLTEEQLERHRRIVLLEKLVRIEDAPYGSTTRMMMRHLFPKTHPLHEGVMGTEATLRAVTVKDVQAFARTCLVPNNATLTVTGRFTVAAALEQLDATLGQLPPGAPLPELAPTPELAEPRAVSVVEDVARMPRVTYAWAFSEPFPEHSDALDLGSVLLPVYTDGLIGMRVESAWVEFGRGGLFALSVTTPRAKEKGEATGNAQFILRNLTQSMLPADVLAFSYHVIDLLTLASLATSDGRATLIAKRARQRPDGSLTEFMTKHWKMTPTRLQQLAAGVLKAPPLLIEAKPVRPLPPLPVRP